MMLFGDQKAVETAERMIMEAIDNREQKAKNRQKEYEKKREAKRRERMLYHLRHAKVGRGCGSGHDLAGSGSALAGRGWTSAS